MKHVMDFYYKCMVCNGNRLLPCIVFCVFVVTSIGAQAVRNLGVSFDAALYTALPPIALAPGIKGDAFPKSITLRPFCPPVGDQGPLSACTGFATGYSAMTIHYALRNRLQKPEQVRDATFSASFIYNSVKQKQGDCGEGISVESALRFLKEKGNCLYPQFDTARSCVTKPDSALAWRARSNRIKDFAPVLPLGSSAPIVINTLKTYLRDSLPVVVVMHVFESFVYSTKGTKIWRKRANEPSLGLHCLVVTGYDEEKRLFEVMSSWGTDWADRGFCYVDYGDMSEACKAAYILFTSGKAMPKPISGSKRPATFPGIPTLAAFSIEATFDFVRVVERDTDYAFVPEAVTHDARTGLYLVQSGPMRIGTNYQLTNQGTAAGQYIYVFSCNAVGKVEQHYPQPFFSALNPGRNTRITIPSAQSTLRLEQAGDEFVVMLCSEVEITDIRSRLDRLSGYSTTNFMSILRHVFPELIQADRQGAVVQYQPNLMQLTARSNGEQGLSAAIVLGLRVE